MANSAARSRTHTAVRGQPGSEYPVQRLLHPSDVAPAFARHFVDRIHRVPGCIDHDSPHPFCGLDAVEMLHVVDDAVYIPRLQGSMFEGGGARDLSGGAKVHPGDPYGDLITWTVLGGKSFTRLSRKKAFLYI